MGSLEQIFAQGLEAFRGGDFEAAAGHFEELLAHVPRDPRVLTLLATTALHRDEMESARAYLDRAGDAFGEIPPVQAVEPAAQLMEVAEALDCVEATYRRISQVVRVAVECVRSMEQANRMRGQVETIAGITRDSGLMRAFFAAYCPQPVGLELPMTVSPAISLRAHTEPKGRWIDLDAPGELRVQYGEYARVYVTRGHAVGIIPGGQVLCGWDFALTAQTKLLHDTNFLDDRSLFVGGWFPHAFDDAHDQCFHLWPEAAQYIDEDVLYLSAPPYFTFGHWQCDFMPRLRALASFPEAKVAIPAELPRKHRDMLALFGIGGDRLIECALGGRYRFRNLIVSRCGTGLAPPPQDVRFVAQALRAAPVPAPRTRLFLTRTAPTRRIVNSDEVTAHLARLGFEFMDMALASIAEQRARLAQADIVIAVIGSDLLAAMFMREGAHLIALDYSPEVDRVTGAVDSASAGIHSAILGIKFQVLACEAADSRGVVVMRKDRDFMVDCEILTGLVKGLT